jgi:hypothetical protein
MSSLRTRSSTSGSGWLPNERSPASPYTPMSFCHTTPYHTERHHQGLGNQRSASEADRSRHGNAVVRRDRLGGLLSYYVWDEA